MKAHFYDPMFYLSSEEMPFSIRLEIRLKDDVRPDSLRKAVEAASLRFPYFSMEVIEKDGELITKDNPLPFVVYEGSDARTLGSAAVNRQLIAFSYDKKTVYIHASHIITDGGGLFPFIKTILFCYFTDVNGCAPSIEGIRLPGETPSPSETEPPLPKKQSHLSLPVMHSRKRSFFRLAEGGLIHDFTPTVYRLRVNEKQVLGCMRMNDGSPSTLFSVLMFRTIWKLHPDIKNDLLCAVSMNMRPVLGCPDNYRMLSTSIPLRCPAFAKKTGLMPLCTSMRGAVLLQSQPENVLHQLKKRQDLLDELEQFPDVSSRCEFLSEAALEDANANTFSISYVGQLGLGEMASEIDAMYNLTDGSTYRNLFLEVNSLNGEFDIAFLQGFSEDIYFRGFIDELKALKIDFREDFSGPLRTAALRLPIQ